MHNLNISTVSYVTKQWLWRGVRCVVGCYHSAVKDQVRKGLDYIIIALQKFIANETTAGTEMLLYMAASTPKTLGKNTDRKEQENLGFLHSLLWVPRRPTELFKPLTPRP